MLQLLRRTAGSRRFRPCERAQRCASPVRRAPRWCRLRFARRRWPAPIAPGSGQQTADLGRTRSCDLHLPAGLPRPVAAAGVSRPQPQCRPLPRLRAQPRRPALHAGGGAEIRQGAVSDLALPARRHRRQPRRRAASRHLDRQTGHRARGLAAHAGGPPARLFDDRPFGRRPVPQPARGVHPERGAADGRRQSIDLGVSQHQRSLRRTGLAGSIRVRRPRPVCANTSPRP